MKNTKATKGRKRIPTIACVMLCSIALMVSGSYAQEKVWAGPLAMCWSVSNDSGSSSAAASDNVKTIFIPKSDRTIQSRQVSTGDLLWTVEYSGDRVSPPFLVDGSLVFATAIPSPDAAKQRKVSFFKVDPVSAISRTSGTVSIGMDDHLDFDGQRLVTTNEQGKVTLFSTDGVELWNAEAAVSKRVPPVLSGDFVYIPDDSGGLTVLRVTDGVLAGRFVSVLPLSGAFALDPISNRLYAGTRDGRVFAFEFEHEKPVWTSRTGGEIKDLLVVDTDVLAVSGDNFVYRLSDGNGRRLWKRKLAGRILGGVMLPGGFAAYASLGSTELVILDIGNGRLVNKPDVKLGDYFAAPPIFAANRLIVRTEKALTAIGPASECSAENENEDAQKTSSFKNR